MVPRLFFVNETPKNTLPVYAVGSHRTSGSGRVGDQRSGGRAEPSSDRFTDQSPADTHDGVIVSIEPNPRSKLLWCGESDREGKQEVGRCHDGLAFPIVGREGSIFAGFVRLPILVMPDAI
jgi:hypothetical protein